ncbi:MAG TPA: hypothetical protein VFC39_21890 [Acidobacteriaceae bacterium]|nr:hypothetical protein [Acidobacteriaceae bacterium]
MRTIGIQPGCTVLLVERRGDEFPAYNALVAGISMDESLAGAKGEPSIEVAFVVPDPAENAHRVLVVPGIVHVSHRDWIEGRAGLAYDELPYPPSGVCRFCHCTEHRACAGGCSWLDFEKTACSSLACIEKFQAEIVEEVSIEVRR